MASHTKECLETLHGTYIVYGKIWPNLKNYELQYLLYYVVWKLISHTRI
jgi:hypothetical protein